MKKLNRFLVFLETSLCLKDCWRSAALTLFALGVLVLPMKMQARVVKDTTFFVTPKEIVYGKRIYAICKTTMVLPEKGGKPEIWVVVDYNPAPGLRNQPFIDILKCDNDVAIDGKADFKFLAIDYSARGYNGNLGRCIGVLAETGKAFAVEARIHYDGKVAERSKRLTAKYKIRLIDRKKYKDRWAKYGMSIDQ